MISKVIKDIYGEALKTKRPMKQFKNKIYIDFGKEKENISLILAVIIEPNEIRFSSSSECWADWDEYTTSRER